MRLHEDKDAFRALLSLVGQRANIREDIVGTTPRRRAFSGI